MSTSADSAPDASSFGDEPARFAAIDLGTNSVLLSVVDCHRAQGSFQSVHEEARVTRLGEGVDETGTLREGAMDRTFDCLRDYVKSARERGARSIVIGGTSALRDAKNGADFREKLERELLVPVEIISGVREAELTFTGAVSGIELGGQLFVFDIGGGSTEFILGHHDAAASRIEFARSLNIGSVRMFERTSPSDPITFGERAVLEQQFDAALKTLGSPEAFGTFDAGVGVAGTVTSLAALSLGLSSYERHRVHGARIHTAALASTIEELAKLTVEERRRFTALEKGRADVIVVGGLWLLAILRWLRLTEVVASDRGVRFGLLAELRARHFSEGLKR